MRKSLICIAVLGALLAGGAGAALLDTCGPFTDVPLALCPFVAEIYALGITAGTSPTTYSPDDALTRGQAAVFAAKTFDQSVARSSRRAALNQWWTPAPPYAQGLGLTYLSSAPSLLASDGADIWVSGNSGTGEGAVFRVRASDASVLGTWPDVMGASGLLVAMGRVFVGGLDSSTGFVGMLDPAQPPGPLNTIASGLPQGVIGLAFDGSRIWTANFGSGGGSVSILTPSPTIPWPVTTITTGISRPFSLVFDGSHVWVIDENFGPGILRKLDDQGNVLQSVPLGNAPRYATFDGANIWVPNFGDNSVSVIQASTGTLLATLTGNGMNGAWAAAFDGQRILITGAYNSVSFFKAADLSPMANFPLVGMGAYGACSDGVNFWIGFPGSSAIGRL